MTGQEARPVDTAIEGVGTGNANRAVIDASSLILLVKAGLLDMSAMAFCMVMTPSVLAEATRPGYPGAGRIDALHRAGSIGIRVPGPPGAEVPSGLGQGERHTIHAFLQGLADFVIIDDGKGAGFCRRRQIPYINALLVPKLLWFAGRMGEAAYRGHTQRLLTIGRYTPAIVRFARDCAARDIDFFIPTSTPRNGSATPGRAGRSSDQRR
jgi:hypothetical protein